MTVRRALAGVRWYLRGVTGESAYDRYVEHARREHPDEPVMSRRDFERRRQDAREARAGALGGDTTRAPSPRSSASAGEGPAARACRWPTTSSRGSAG